MKKLRVLALALAAVMLLSACGVKEEENAGAAYDFGIPTDSAEDLSALKYVMISEVDGQYQCGQSGGYTFVSALAPQFAIGGCAHPDENSGKYYRLDYAMKEYYSQQNASRAANTTGITVRFCTDAPEICINAEVYNVTEPSAHMNARGAYGFDVYVGTGTNRTYCGESKQLMTDPAAISEVVKLPGGYQEVQINLPLYCGTKNIQIGFPAGTKVAAPTQRSYDKIVFYGSSITQGCAASRPGLAYTNILGLTLNADVHNLGFSGSALGEQVIAQYIAGLENISAFVMDYDYNNSIEGLQQTHYAFYKTVRNAHPEIPIILVSRPVYLKEPDQDQLSRVQIIMDTYNKAVSEGDKNVYFINGDDFFPNDYPDLYTVDTVHPNDLGMYYMAKTIYPVLKSALDGEK